MKKVFLLILLLFSIIYCQRDQESKKKDEITIAPREGAEQFVLVDTKGNKKNWVLKAERANNYDDSIKIYDVIVEFYDSKGIYNSTLTSDSGVVYSVSGDMSATGHVKVTSKDSTILKTDYLDWNNKRKKIITEDFVEITKKHSIITGKGMESDPNLEHIEIKKDFHAISRDIKED